MTVSTNLSAGSRSERSGEPGEHAGDPGANGGDLPPPAGGKRIERLDRVVIRFAGDSGDGMQLTGDRFTAETASLGNDLATLPTSSSP